MAGDTKTETETKKGTNSSSVPEASYDPKENKDNNEKYYEMLFVLFAPTSEYYKKVKKQITNKDHRHPFDVMAQIIRVIPKCIIIRYAEYLLKVVETSDELASNELTYIWDEFGKILDNIASDYTKNKILTQKPRWQMISQKIFNCNMT